MIPNGIELDLPPATGSPGGRCLGFLGRLVEQKNPLLLLDVLDALRAERLSAGGASAMGRCPMRCGGARALWR